MNIIIMGILKQNWAIPFYGRARVIGFKHRIDPEPCLFE